MILQALTAYYEQLLKQGKVEAPGWDSRFKVSYELRLGPDGQLLALNDLRKETPRGKKTVIAPRELPVPHRVLPPSSLLPPPHVQSSVDFPSSSYDLPQIRQG